MQHMTIGVTNRVGLVNLKPVNRHIILTPYDFVVILPTAFLQYLRSAIVRP